MDSWEGVRKKMKRIFSSPNRNFAPHPIFLLQHPSSPSSRVSTLHITTFFIWSTHLDHSSQPITASSYPSPSIAGLSIIHPVGTLEALLQTFAPKPVLSRWLMMIVVIGYNREEDYREGFVCDRNWRDQSGNSRRDWKGRILKLERCLNSEWNVSRVSV